MGQDFFAVFKQLDRFGVRRPAFYHERLPDDFLAPAQSSQFNYYHRAHDAMPPDPTDRDGSEEEKKRVWSCMPHQDSCCERFVKGFDLENRSSNILPYGSVKSLDLLDIHANETEVFHCASHVLE